MDLHPVAFRILCRKCSYYVTDLKEVEWVDNLLEEQREAGRHLYTYLVGPVQLIPVRRANKCQQRCALFTYSATRSTNIRKTRVIISSISFENGISVKKIEAVHYSVTRIYYK